MGAVQISCYSAEGEHLGYYSTVEAAKGLKEGKWWRVHQRGDVIWVMHYQDKYTMQNAGGGGPIEISEESAMRRIRMWDASLFHHKEWDELYKEPCRRGGKEAPRKD